MEAKKEEVPPAYVNDTPDIHDEKPTGAIVQEEAVHSVALTEALAAGQTFLMVKKHAAAVRHHGCWLPGLHNERIRLLLDGCHQCHEELPEHLWSHW